AVGEREVQMRQATLAGQTDARVAEAVEGIDADDLARFLGERERHPAAAAPGVEHAAADRDAGTFAKPDDLRAPVILAQGVILFQTEPLIGVRLDGAVVNEAHAFRLIRRCRRRPGTRRPRTS